jgi:2-dehydropantoate 2-reductase
MVLSAALSRTPVLLPRTEEKMAPKVCIVGCGALGSVFAAHLCRIQDIEVHAYDVSQEQTRAINDRGLRISGPPSSPYSSTPPLIRASFLSAILESLPQRACTRAAAEQAAHAFNESSAVCSVQNGLGNEEIIAEYVKYVIRGATPMAHI